MGLCATMLISLFAYVSLTVATIFATAGRSSAVYQGSLLTSRISELEGAYLAKQSSITPSEAAARGFVTPKKVSMVVPQTSANALSLRTQ